MAAGLRGSRGRRLCQRGPDRQLGPPGRSVRSPPGRTPCRRSRRRDRPAGHFGYPAQCDRGGQLGRQPCLYPPHPRCRRAPRLRGGFDRPAPGTDAGQREQLWFWTVGGHKDPAGDKDTWNNAVTRIREAGPPCRRARPARLPRDVRGHLPRHRRGRSAVRPGGRPRERRPQPRLGNLVRLHRPIEDWREMLHTTLPYANYWHVKNYPRDEDLARDHSSPCHRPWSRASSATARHSIRDLGRIPGHHLHRALRRRRAQRNGGEPGIPAPPRPAQAGRVRARHQPGGPGTPAPRGRPALETSPDPNPTGSTRNHDRDI